MIEQKYGKDFKEFMIILAWVAVFVVLLFLLHSQIRYVDVTVKDHRAGYEVNGEYYDMELPARRDGEVLHWAYLSFYPSKHIRRDDVQFWVGCVACFWIFLVMGIQFWTFHIRMVRHSEHLQLYGVRLQGSYITHWTRRVKRSIQHVAKIDFLGVEITTKRHSSLIHDYSDCVAYVNRNDPSDYTILVGGKIIE